MTTPKKQTSFSVYASSNSHGGARRYPCTKNLLHTWGSSIDALNTKPVWMVWGVIVDDNTGKVYARYHNLLKRWIKMNNEE
jgi:hypothetical protein